MQIHSKNGQYERHHNQQGQSNNAQQANNDGNKNGRHNHGAHNNDDIGRAGRSGAGRRSLCACRSEVMILMSGNELQPGLLSFTAWGELIFDAAILAL